MKTFTNSNFAGLYKEVLNEVVTCPDNIVAPRGNTTYELYNVALELTNPIQNLFLNKIRAPSQKYLAGEMLWYFSGRNDLGFIEKYSKFWKAIANTDGTCNSAYGYLLFNERNEYGFTEWGWALKSLENDQSSRQAIIRFNKPRFSYTENKDFICTLVGHFLIRNNTLFFTVIMRSNDIRTGVQYDIPFFTTLHFIMYKQLLLRYQNLQMGTYTHIVNSIHIYEKDIDEATEALREAFESTALPQIETALPISEDGTPSQKYIDLSYGLVDYTIKDSFYHWVAENADVFKTKKAS